MTYKDHYRQLNSFEEMQDRVLFDTKVAIMLGGNPDRIKAIEDAMNKIVTEKGWDVE